MPAFPAPDDEKADTERTADEERAAKDTYDRFMRDLRHAVEDEVRSNDSGYEQQALNTFEGFESALKDRDWSQLRNFASNLQNLHLSDPARRKDLAAVRKYLESQRRKVTREFMNEASREASAVVTETRQLLRADVTEAEIDALSDRCRTLSRQLEQLSYDESRSTMQSVTSSLQEKANFLGYLRPAVSLARSQNPRAACYRLQYLLNQNILGETPPDLVREFGTGLVGRENALRFGLIAPRTRDDLKAFRETTDEFQPPGEEYTQFSQRAGAQALGYRYLDAVFTQIEEGHPEAAALQLLAFQQTSYGVRSSNIINEAQRSAARALLGPEAPPLGDNEIAPAYLGRLLADATAKQDYRTMENVIRAQDRLKLGENTPIRLDFLRAMQLGDGLAKIGQNAAAAAAYRSALEKQDTCGVPTSAVLDKLLALHRADPSLAVAPPPSPSPAAPPSPQTADLSLRALRFQVMELGKQLEALAAKEAAAAPAPVPAPAAPASPAR